MSIGAMFSTPLAWFSGRRGMGLIALAGIVIGLTVAALELWGGLKPCALCWTQRGVLALMTLIALIGWALWPTSRLGRRVLAGSLSATCLLGIIVAIRHLYVIAHPEAISCGASIEYMIGLFPWQDVMRALFLGGPGCSKVSSVLWVPIPVWSLIAFTGLTALSLWSLRRTD